MDDFESRSGGLLGQEEANCGTEIEKRSYPPCANLAGGAAEVRGNHPIIYILGFGNPNKISGANPVFVDSE